MATLPLTGIVDVTVNVSPITSIRVGFNTALILGNTAIITPEQRIKSYSSLAAMVADGFATDDPEYLAASVYFAQNPAPSKVFVGVIDTDETLVDALTACREMNSEWYVAIPTEGLVATLSDVDITNAATYIESAQPSSILALSLNNASTYLDTMDTLKVGAYRRTISMLDNVVANASKTAIAGIIGYAMGVNKPGSAAFTLAYKSIIGIEPLTTLSEVDLQAILDVNGNIYVNQATYYNLFRQGKMASGASFDEVLYLDMLIEQIKFNVMVALTTSFKIPQTNEGINILSNVISNACEDSVANGFIAPGVWTGPTILNLNTNDALSRGYLVQFDSLATQSQIDREARIAPNCYVCVKTAGAIEHVVIAVTVNR